MTEALIIFVRNLEPGKVKTRIGAVAGHAFALAVYEKLLQHTYAITVTLPVDKYVYYASEVGKEDLWNSGSYSKARQEGIDLGMRMQQAFQALFTKGYQKVCIIGSDCYELTTALLEEAYRALEHSDIVIGPTTDGGYYLLGMKNGVKEIFQGVEWSTDKVLQQTLEKIPPASRTTLLPMLTDVDRIEDVPEAWRQSAML